MIKPNLRQKFVGQVIGVCLIALSAGVDAQLEAIDSRLRELALTLVKNPVVRKLSLI
jgi:hypothetical protein